MRAISLLDAILLTSLEGAAQNGEAAKPAKTIEVEVVYVGPGGFFPSHIARPKGRFVLMVLDHSGLPNLVPAVQDSHGNTVSQMSLGPSKQSHKNSDVMDLGKGQFHLKEPSHPKWDLTIDIGD